MHTLGNSANREAHPSIRELQLIKSGATVNLVHILRPLVLVSAIFSVTPKKAGQREYVYSNSDHSLP
jgi:hypothetical protein